MNREKIIDQASNIFSNLNLVSQDVYKGELRIDDKAAGLYFLNLQGNVKADEFKLLQEEVLSEEFYNQKNELQWNIYFILIMDSVDKTDKQIIESDEKYARKYVFTENEFLDFFTLDKSSGVVQSDIVGEWKKKLDSVDLQEVYGKATYVDGVNRFLSDKTVKYKSPTSATQTSDILKINFINRITIKPEFRPFPIIRQFEFGKVNLFKGVNGVGKTSTLEAIEMIVCGRTFRNPHSKEQEGCVEAVLNNRIAESCTPAIKEKYRLRDLEWYNNSYPRDNSLQRSFNRFNFFDTDAANNFSQSNSESEINQALENLVLGGEFKHLKDRVNGFYTRLKPEFNRLFSAMSEAQSKIKAANQILSKDNKDDGIELILKELAGKIAALNFVEPTNLKRDNLGSIEILLNQLGVIITRIRNSSNGFKESEKSVKQRSSNLSERLSLFNAFKIELALLAKIISDKEVIIKTISEQIEILILCIGVLDKPKLLSLEGLSQRTSIARDNVKKIQQIEDNLLPVNYLSYSNSESIDICLIENRNTISNLKQELFVLSSQISSRLELLGSLERLIREAKDKGKEILILDPTMEDCPMCNSHLGHDELMIQINNTLTSIDDNTPSRNSDDLVELKLKKEVEIKDAELKIEVIQKIKNTYEEIFNKSSNKLSLSNSINEISKFYFNKSEFENHLNELQSIGEFGAVNEMTEDKLREVKLKLDSLFSGKFQLIVDQKDTISEELKKIQENKILEDQRMDKSLKQKSVLSEEIKSKLELPVDQTFKAQDILLELENELSEIKSLAESYNELKSIVKFDEEGVIDDLSLKVSIVEKNLLSLKSAITTNQVLSQAKKDKDEGDKFVKQNDKLLNRLDKAIKVLETLDSKGGSSELSLFFNSNFKQILEIFKTIHAPREFKDLQYDNGEILLIDETDVPRQVSEISTGQRAALALSIFISMNRMLKKGPNIIIFDDPISHVDDLNALSFLDFLRIFILKEKKQIFFSSANSRLSTLFQKKFEFLGNDFKEWELKRNNTL